MKFYKTDDGWYFENEQDAINHVSIYNRAVQSEVEEELKKSKDDGIDRTEIIRIINKKRKLYVEVDFDNSETVIDFMRDYQDLKDTVQKLKEWTHLQDCEDLEKR